MAERTGCRLLRVAMIVKHPPNEHNDQHGNDSDHMEAGTGVFGVSD